MAGQHFLHCLKAVLGKNFLLKRRDWLSTLLELLLPVALMGLLIWIRTEIKTEDVPERSYLSSPENNPTWFPSYPQSSAELPLPLQLACNSSVPTGGCPEVYAKATWLQRKEYYLGQALDGLLPLHMALYDQRLGVVGEAGSSLAEFVGALPGYEGMVRHFESEGEYEEYLASSSYGFAEDSPQLFGAIIVKEAAVKDPASGAFSGSWDVVIQLNASGPGSLDIQGATDINTKLKQPVSPLQKGLEMSTSKIYWSGGLFASTGLPLPTGGFVDLQSLIYAWVYNTTGAFSMPPPEALPKCMCQGKDGDLTSDLRQCRADQLQVTVLRMLTPYWSTGALPQSLRGCLGRLSSLLPLSLREVPFPTPAYTKDNFAALMKGVFGLFFVLVYVWPMTRIMKSLVQDKEENKNEVMKMMGLPAEAINVGWYGTYGLLWVLPSALIVLICWTSVFTHSNKFIIFVFFWLFGLCVISLSSFVAVFFSRAKTASVVGALIMLLLYFPYVFVASPDYSTSAKTWTCISPSVALSFGAGLIADLESAGVGVQWGNLGQMLDNFSMGAVLAMLLLDMAFFAVLAWYFDKVLVVGAGTRQPFCFLFTRRYWRPLQRGLTQNEVEDLERGFDDELPDNPKYEPVGPQLAEQRSILLRDLSKEFSTADGKLLKAVQGITLNLYTGQVFCLLGHNGAGKSTTINMLSGMLPVDGGDAIVYGNSVKRDMASIRTMLGVCPQHDVVWASLTVKEHLEFFAKLKGVERQRRHAEVQQIISDVGLEEKRQALAATLSGGQKRRLSAAIALIGGSKVVFLDEPSSGVDPFSRRELWDCLRQKKEGRTVILTTHFMDEAEELGDRIAIMAAGQVKCVGSSLFLKSKYGVGYTLSITKRPGASASQVEALKALIGQRCKRAELLSEVGSELIYRMPMEESCLFPELFERLEQMPEQYGTEIFSVSVTTLDEVFLRVGQDHTEADVAADERLQQRSFIRQISSERIQRSLSNEAPASMDVAQEESQSRTPLRAPRELGGGTSGSVVFLRHVNALLAKRYHNARRDRKAWCCQVAMPLFFLLFALLTMKYAGVGQYAATPVSLASLPGDQRLPYAAGPGVDAGRARSFMEASGGGAEELPGQMSAEDFDGHLLRTYYRSDGAVRYGAVRFQSLPDWTAPDRNATVGDYTVAGFREPGKAWGRQGELGVPVGTLWGEVDRQGLGEVPLGELNNRAQLDLFWNSTARDVLPALYHELHQQLLRSSVGSQRLRGASLKVSNKPFSLTSAQKDLTNTQTSLNLALGFAFIPASVGAFVVLERENRCKHLQLISGVNFVSYWLSTWIWDILNYLVPAGFSVLLILLFQIQSLVNAENLPWTLLCVLMYGISCTSFTYMLSFLFSSHTSAQNLFLVFYLFTGGILMIVAIILAVIPSTAHLMQHVLIYIFRLLPNFCLADALTNLVTRSNPGLWRSQGCPMQGCAPYDLIITGYDLLYMGVGSIIWFLITLGLELALATPKVRAWLRIGIADVPRSPQAPALDRHVQLEKERVLSGAADEEMVVVKGIRKVYPGRHGLAPKVAVEDMYFGIPEGECFGYLGMNGAGKTTTMRILTGEELCTRGEATLGGYDIKTQQSEVRRLIGYCPQFDALIGTLTAREHLTLFARIKGVTPGRLGAYVDGMLDRLTLRPYADKQARTFSGGTRRKLSLGIALIGDPRCIFLDEPTTGVDPESRRFMWKLISSTMLGRSVILTTHSMDECEALCGRIGIMVNGQLVCLGSAALLKATHGYGYQFEVALSTGADLKAAHSRLRAFLEKLFPDGVHCGEGSGGEGAPAEQFRQRAQFRLPKGRVPMSELFRQVERYRSELEVSEYMISETTLEQLFLHFAKQQRSEEDGAESDAASAGAVPSLATSSSSRPTTTTSRTSRSALRAPGDVAAK